MSFNESKCKVMHFGRHNPEYQYTMEGAIIKSTDQEWDVGVVHRSLKPSKQCAQAASTANQVLGQSARAYHFRDGYISI